MPVLIVFRCCEHCRPGCFGGPDEHVYRCYETDNDGELCKRGGEQVTVRTARLSPVAPVWWP